MLEITNRKKFPVQLIVRSKLAPKQMTTLNIPSLGGGKNIYYLEDERVTEYIDRAKKAGLISTKQVTNKIRKGE